MAALAADTGLPAPRPAPEPEPAPVAPARLGEPRTRLQEAREHVTRGAAAPALVVYQALVDDGEMLAETRDDLLRLVESQPKEPKVLRLLGDTYMRLGELQTALETYLSALNKL
jgi:uncharacterized protein HemY